MKQTFPIRGATVKKMRARMVWTQTNLARESGLSAQHISEIERAEVSGVHASTVHKLARALGVEPVDLIEADVVTAA